MKKILAFVLVLSFAFGLVACSETKRKSKKEKKKVETKVEEVEESEATPTPTPKPTPIPTDIPVETSVVYLYEEGEEPIKVDWDNLTLDEDKAKSFGVKRLSDDYIYTFVPGSNSGPIFPIEMSYCESFINDYGLVNSVRYGFIDSTGTIVCDDVFTECYRMNDGISYVTCRKDLYGNEYCGLLLADGSKFIERPSDYFYFGYEGDFLYIFDNVSNTLVVLDSYGNVLSEVPNNFRTYSETDNYNYCSKGFYYDTWDEGDGIYCYATGQKIYLGTSDPSMDFAGYYDDLIFYDKNSVSYCVYDPNEGIIVESGKYSHIWSRSKYYIGTTLGGGYDLIDLSGNVIDSFDSKYDDVDIFGDYLFALKKDSTLYIYDILNKTGKEYKTIITSLYDIHPGMNCFSYKRDSGYECYDYEMNLLSSTSFKSSCLYDPATDTFYVKKDGNTLKSLPNEDIIELGDINSFSSYNSYVYDGFLLLVENSEPVIKSTLLNSDGEVICVYYEVYLALDD